MPLPRRRTPGGPAAAWPRSRPTRRRHGYPGIGELVLARVASGASLAAVSREAGLHKDWLSRHLADIDPAAAAAARHGRPAQRDARWLSVLGRLGFGFSDQSHLTRWFIRCYGITPGDYQRATALAP